jgi:flagellar motor switch/type III secretory pathway protein FliN
VRLVTDNNEEPVATGELVEIEGQLGVRLTKVFI